MVAGHPVEEQVLDAVGGKIEKHSGPTGYEADQYAQNDRPSPYPPVKVFQFFQ